MRPEDHLSTDAVETDFVVDMSNIVWRTELGGEREVDLDRFIGLIEGLVSYTKDRSLTVYGVADWSLLRNRTLHKDERDRLHRWRRKGLIEVRDGADPRILAIADAGEQRVVCFDNYLDFHRQYPWIPGNTDRFFEPFRDPDGRISVRPRTMPEATEWRISRKEEQGQLKVRGLYQNSRPRRDLLSRLWRCQDPECPMFGTARRDDQPLPRRNGDAVVCPTHGKPLTDIGPRPRTAQVKVRVDGAVQSRFLLAPEDIVTLGRAPGASGVTVDVPDKPAISRKHVRLRWTGSELYATDISRHGSQVRRGGAEPFPLKRDQPFKMRKGEEIVLADGVELLLSGREFVFEESPPPARPPKGEAARRTVLVLQG